MNFINDVAACVDQSKTYIDTTSWHSDDEDKFQDLVKELVNGYSDLNVEFSSAPATLMVSIGIKIVD